MIETAARGVQFLLAIGIAYLVALWFALVAWTFRDIEARSRSVFTQVFSTLLVVLFFVPGLLLYLILRPKETRHSAAPARRRSSSASKTSRWLMF